VYGCEACPLSRVVESAQWMVAQRERAVAPFHMGAGALENLGKLGGFGLELILLPWPQLSQHSTWLTQRNAEMCSTRPERLTLCHRPG
jgi:hypothetical protein